MVAMAARGLPTRGADYTVVVASAKLVKVFFLFLYMLLSIVVVDAYGG